jgi:signal peptidase II
MANPQPTRALLRAGILLLTVSLFGCDHATKIAAHAALAGGRAVPLVTVRSRDILELRYAPNPDTAFSVFRTLGIAPDHRLLVVLAAAALVGVVVAWAAAARRSRERARPLEHVAYAFVLAGALGNVVDRAVRGFVVDFIHVARWPIFNVADVLVGVGIGLLVLARMRTRAPPPDSPPACQAPP